MTTKIKRIIAKLIIKARYLKSVYQIRKLKNTYNGKRCFIVGNGPSLRLEDLEKLKEDYCFGTHQIYRIFDKTDWRPNFYCAQDQVLINQSFEQINNLKVEKKFIASPINSWSKKVIKNSILTKIIIKDFYPDLPEFSEDVSKGIYEGFTVTYMCLQLAVYMGFKEIYLLGVDHHYNISRLPNGEIIVDNSAKNHFIEGYDLPVVPQTSKSTLAYESAKVYADKHNIKIYNATRGGSLEVFERVLFDELFEGERG